MSGGVYVRQSWNLAFRTLFPVTGKRHHHKLCSISTGGYVLGVLSGLASDRGLWPRGLCPGVFLSANRIGIREERGKWLRELVPDVILPGMSHLFISVSCRQAIPPLSTPRTVALPVLKTSTGTHPFFNHQQILEERGVAPFSRYYNMIHVTVDVIIRGFVRRLGDIQSHCLLLSGFIRNRSWRSFTLSLWLVGCNCKLGFKRLSQ